MTPVADESLDRQSCLTGAIILCQTLSGLTDQQITGDGGIVKDAAQWSRIKGGSHFFPQNKLGEFMDLCGNEAPLAWLARSRGYSLTPLETEMERRLRLERAKSDDLARENEILRSLLIGKQ